MSSRFKDSAIERATKTRPVNAATPPPTMMKKLFHNSGL